jgi:hypothetical protein
MIKTNKIKGETTKSNTIAKTKSKETLLMIFYGLGWNTYCCTASWK